MAHARGPQGVGVTRTAGATPPDHEVTSAREEWTYDVMYVSNALGGWVEAGLGGWVRMGDQ